MQVTDECPYSGAVETDHPVCRHCGGRPVTWGGDDWVHYCGRTGCDWAGTSAEWVALQQEASESDEDSVITADAVAAQYGLFADLPLSLEAQRHDAILRTRLVTMAEKVLAAGGPSGSTEIELSVLAHKLAALVLIHCGLGDMTIERRQRERGRNTK